MLTALRYLSAALRYPRRESLGLISGGLGIERRAKELREEWCGHLKSCFEIEKRWIQEQTTSGELNSLTVLGAGRLLDLDLALCCSSFKEIHLVDGDPLAVESWRKARSLYPATKFFFHSVELTGVLFNWRSTLRARLKTELRGRLTFQQRWKRALECVRAVPISLAPKPQLRSYLNTDAILSLNILSQLPLGWQNVVEHALHRHFSSADVAKLEVEWVMASFVGGKALIEDHLNALNESKAESCLIISDTEYLFYRNEYSAENLECEAMEALCNFDLRDKSEIRRLCPKFSTIYSEPWLWHIAPKRSATALKSSDGQNSVGEIHRVIALTLTKEM